MQNLVVLGGSYAGASAARTLAQGLRNKYRVLMVDRNRCSHMNHQFVVPRLGILNGHENKAFIPYTHLFDSLPDSGTSSSDSTRHLILKAHINSLSPNSLTLDRAFPEHGLTGPTIPFAYCVYALGSRMPTPIDMWSHDTNAAASQPGKTAIAGEVNYDGTKEKGIDWLKRCQERVKRAGSVLCVGGGALGIQFATDIKSLYPEKQVALLHSRRRLLPRFDERMHFETMRTMNELGVDLILGERLDLESTKSDNIKLNASGQRVVRTLTGREVAADLLLLCTGQIPNTDILAQMDPGSVDPATKLAYVLPTMQLGLRPSTSQSREVPPSVSGDKPLSLPQTPYPNIFVVGDAADAFGAIKAGHEAHAQSSLAAQNIIRLVRSEGDTPPVLERYEPSPPGIKVSMGIGRKALIQMKGVVGLNDHPEPDDLEATWMWIAYGWPQTPNEEDLKL